MRKFYRTEKNLCSTNEDDINAQKFICRIIISFIIVAMVGLITEAQGQVVTQPVADQSSTIKHYTYTYMLSQTQKKDIRYIIVKASNGDIKTCFDACDVCYSYNKGYSQSGTQLRCNNCGNRFNIDGLGTQGSGGCWPGYLVHSLDGDKVSINVSDLVAGEHLFPAQDVSDVTDNKINAANYTIIVNNDELTVKMPIIALRNFNIVSLDGKFCKSLTSNSNELNTDIYSLSNGIYLLSIEESGQVITKTFFVSK
ncbi:MAG: Fe-S-containing protein [FCB group bacterium]|jgi:hypothetical protein